MGWRWAFIWVWLGGGGDGRLFEAGRLLTFSTFRMDAYSRWALIRGCALIRINKVYKELTKLKSGTLVYILIINNLLETINLKPVERSSQIFLTLTVVNSLMSRVTWYDPNDQCASCFTLDETFLLVNNQTLTPFFADLSLARSGCSGAPWVIYVSKKLLALAKSIFTLGTVHEVFLNGSRFVFVFTVLHLSRVKIKGSFLP